MLGMVVVLVVVVDEHADYAWKRAGYCHFSRTKERHPIKPQAPRRDRGKFGVEIRGHREDAADDLFGLQSVSFHQLAHELVSGVEDRLRLVFLHGVGPPERVQPHEGGIVADGRRRCAAVLGP